MERYEKQRPSEAPQELEGSALRSLDSEKQVVASDEYSGVPQRSRDSEKQVVSGPSDDMSPIPVASEYEAGKEVTSSWQTQSREENAPIPVEFNDQPSGSLMNDIKGQPPAYDSVARQRSQSDSDGLLTTPTSIEPDTSALAPRAEDRSAVGQLLSWIPTSLRLSQTQISPLMLPIAIPQIDIPPSGESVPFTRCYTDALSAHDVPMAEFLSFLDGLALAQAPNAALQGLKMFGVGVGYMPLPIIAPAGRGLAKLAGSGSGDSGSRARLYIERAKKEYFAPRNLSLTIVKDTDLNSRLGIPSHASRLAPLTKNTLVDTCVLRRIGALAPYTAPLRFDVPEPEARLEGVQKMARKHLESQFKAKGKKVSRLRERQWDGVASAGAEGKEWEEQYTFKMGQLRRVQDDMVREQKAGDGQGGLLREMQQALEGLQKEIQELETRRYMTMRHSSGGSRGVEAEMEEIEMVGKLRWIVIENLRI
jgi:hypothetical protein